MTDSVGTPTTLTVTLNDRFSTNGMSGGGGLLTPDATLLGDLAIATATSDYFFYEADQTDCSMTFGGLDADKAYRFHIFASRKATDNRTGNYQLSGYNIWGGTLQAAGTNLGGDGVNQNNSSILVSDYMFAGDALHKNTLTIAYSPKRQIIMNDRLSYEEKKELPDSVYGLPERREYPMPDAAHVRAAEAYFRYCPEDLKPRLARAILERAREFGVDVESPTVLSYANA